MDDNYEVIEASVRDTFASVVWSHKIQEKQADICSERFKCLETAKILSASFTSVGVVSLVFTDQIWIKLISALISFVSVFVSAFFKSFDLQTMVSQHKAAANNLLEVRDQLKLILLQIRLKQESAQVIYEKYEGVDSYQVRIKYELIQTRKEYFYSDCEGAVTTNDSEKRPYTERHLCLPSAHRNCSIVMYIARFF